MRFVLLIGPYMDDFPSDDVVEAASSAGMDTSWVSHRTEWDAQSFDLVMTVGRDHAGAEQYRVRLEGAGRAFVHDLAGAPPRGWLIDRFTEILDVYEAQLLPYEAELSVGIEHLVGDTLRSLEAENSTLRMQLDAAGIRIAFLEGQLHALAEANATGRRTIVRAMLAAVAAIALAAAGGAAEGVAGGVAAPHADRGDTAAQLVRDCMHLEELVRELEEDG